MVAGLLNLIFGSKNDREINELRPIVAAINALEPSVLPLTDATLAEKSVELRKRHENGESLDDLLPEAFAVCREMSKRVLSMRHFDVQLMGGMILHRGRIAEMKTGEGKTLVATLALYLNALSGKGVHLVTVNDYLAKRDAQWMGVLYHALGMSVGVIQHDASFLFDPQYDAADKRLQNLRPCTRQEAYRADITYGTNNEYGFDYLRDNLIVANLNQCVQRELNFCDRRRGGQHPHRRGADSAHYFRPNRRIHGFVLPDQFHHSTAQDRARLHHRGKNEDRGADRGGQCAGGETLGHREFV